MTQSRVDLGVGALTASAVLTHALLDHGVLSGSLYLVVVLGASLAACVGAERGPSDDRLVRRLIAAGVALAAVGDLLWQLLEWAGEDTDVSVADPAWFISYFALCAAAWVMLRRTHPVVAGTLSVVIDAATVAVVGILVFWSVSIGAIVADQSLTPFVRMVWSSYPVMDAILLALVVRLLMYREARSALDRSFAVGVCLWLAADITYLQAPGPTFRILMDSAWMVASVLLGRAAWRVGAVPAHVANPRPQSWKGPLLIAIGPLLVPPMLVLIADARGEEEHQLLMILGATGLIALAFVRTALLMQSEQRAHRDLEVARDAALEASRVKSEFLATMSHELRTPLTCVLGAGEILEDTRLDEFQLELVRRIRRSGDVLRGLVDGVLDFSRIEAGHCQLAATRFDLHSLVDNAADMCLPRAARAGIGFEHRVAPDVPRIVVGDPDRLLQVLRQLLDNAVKFTPEGWIEIKVRLAVPCDAGDSEVDSVAWVELVVTDTGIGIGQEHLASVWESFRQIDGSSTRLYGGSGLGLAIGKQLMELMGGSLTATSTLGAGSAFVARIPLGIPADEGVTGAAEHDRAAQRAARSRPAAVPA